MTRTRTISSTRITRTRRSAIATLVAGALVLFGATTLAVAEHAQYRQRIEAQVLSDVGETRARLESALANRLSLVDGAAALTVAHQGDVESEFEEFALGLAGSHRSYTGRAGSDPALRSLQLAPAGVVTYVWPVEGNEDAVGHDLIADPVRGPAVVRAIEERRFVLAGPFELLQGGSGLVGRNPIYLDEAGQEEFWGFATVVLNFDVIAEEALLTTAEDRNLNYAIRGRDGLGANGETFLGDPAVFDHNPVLLDVLLPNGTWQVAAVPASGWPVIWRRLTPVGVFLGGLGIAIALAMAVWRSEKARRAIERISTDLSRIIHATASPILAVDGNGIITEWNRAAERLSGIDRAEAVGSRFADGSWRPLADDRDAEALIQAVRDASEGRSTGDVRVTLRTEQAVILDFDVTPRSSDGLDIGAVCIAQDVTARLDAERVRAENLAMARSARFKDEFLAGMSHELRTPLNAIIGLSQVLKKGTFGALESKQQTYVEQIGASGEHLLALINDVLDLAKLEANATQLVRRQTDLTAVVHQSLGVIAPLAAKKNLTVTSPDVRGDTTAWVDERRIRQVVLNLLSNAVKFTDGGGRIGVKLRGSDDTVDIVVWDTGIGIADTQRHLLFEPFQQIDGSLAREHEGTGLGLAMVAKLVELHGGSVGVESDPNKGSCFAVTIPRHASAPPYKSVVPIS
ncbi:MAG: ATP-binding protein [Acidimicrobiia bacterium]|nr:ATP-binding protein [Acidimicrobiia bacterium]